jgi:membrane-associated phospholipid phosphatase
MLAWLLSRRFGWRWAVAAWTSALGLVVVVVSARVYIGWSWPSEAIASTLLGGLWVLVFMVAWHTRDRVRAQSAEARTPAARPVPEAQDQVADLSPDYNGALS